MSEGRKAKKRTVGESGNRFNKDQLDMSLRDVEDVMGRALLTFVILGDTARDIVNETGLTGNKITVGVERKYLTKEALSTLKFYLKDTLPDPIKDFVYEPSGHPKYKTMPKVFVKIIERRWKFLKAKDYKFYMATQYNIPNPFESYWKSRHLIR